MKVFRFTQYTPEWWEARRGVPTASCFGNILTPKTGKPSASAFPYICQLIADRLRDNYGQEEEYVSAAMKNGTLLEPEARSFYEFTTGERVELVGFCKTDDGRFGCSPDAMGLELKCPEAKTHVSYLLAGELPDEYRPQVHGSMIVTGHDSWNFMSYCPGFPPLLVTVRRDEYTRLLADAMDSFWTIYQDKWKLVQAMLPEPKPEPVANPDDDLPPMF